MNWLDFYLICFAVGAGFSLLALFGGTFHAPHFHLHVPGAQGHGGGGHSGAAFNVGTMAAFLLWFGAGGYLITRFESWWFIWGLLLAMVLGLAGAGMVFWFLSRVLLRSDIAMDPADYEMVGVLGRIISPIRDGGGPGEMSFTQQGQRSCAAVLSESGQPIPKDTEVIVTRYEKGVAYVRGFDELG